MAVANPFQDILDRLSNIEYSQSRLEKLLSVNPIQPKEELPINIDEACRVTGYAKPSIYSKFSRREIPGYRRGQRLYFYRSELLAWINSGKRSTLDEIKAEALNSLER
ncbi:MAG: helix-turn-helix domain-containing protein [Bacteroidales bacterium]